MINKDLEKKLKKNMEFSEKLCEVLNKNVKYNTITYSAIASNEDIGVRQILDKRGLQYNVIYLKDEIVNECSLKEIVDLVWVALGRGDYWSVVPIEKEIDLYDKLKAHDWFKEDIWIGEGNIYINNEEFYIDEIESIKVDKDIIELQFQDENEGWCKTTIKRGLEIKTEEINKNRSIPFNIIFNDDKEEQFIRNININEIDMTVPIGRIFAESGELHYKDKLGNSIICELDDITEICYLVNKNEYQIEFISEDNEVEYGFFNQYGFEM